MADPKFALSTGVIGKVFDAFSTAAATSDPVAVPSGTNHKSILWQTSFDVAPSAINIRIEGSLDNVAWNTLATTTATAGAVGTIAAYPFVRAVIASATKGSNNTTTVSFVLKSSINLDALALTGGLTLSNGQLLLPDGTAAAPSLGFAGDPTQGIYRGGVGLTYFGYNSASRFYISALAAGLGLDTQYFSLGTSGDVRLYRDAANTLALRNSTNAQTVNIYNTYTDASNYERGEIEWVSNNFVIGTAAAGTGSGRTMKFQVSGTARWAINGTALYPEVTDAYDFGAAGAQARVAYVSRSTQGSKSKALTESADTTYCSVAIPQTAGSNSGSGEVIYEIYATDGTDTQSLSGRFKFAAVNKTGTLTIQVEDDQNAAAACSAGTLTATLGAAAGTDLINLTCNAVSSLTQTTFVIRYRLDMPQPNTITPA